MPQFLFPFFSFFLLRFDVRLNWFNTKKTQNIKKFFHFPPPLRAPLGNSQYKIIKTFLAVFKIYFIEN